MSDNLIRFQALYSPDASPDLPQDFIIKTNQGYPHAQAEARFYRDIIPLLKSPPIPQTFDVGLGEDHDFYVLQADLAETHVTSLNEHREPTLENLGAIVDQIARVHATCWDKPFISDDVFIDLRRDICDMAQASRPNDLRDAASEIIEGRLKRMFNIAPELPESWHEICRNAIAAWPDTFAPRISAANLTLIHADLHPWNVLVPADESGPPVILDWELLCRGLGIYDVAYLMLRCRLEPAERRVIEQTLIGRYHERLVSLGIEGYTYEDCVNDYRLSIIPNILPPLAWGRPRNLTSTMEAYFDWDCDQLS